MQISAEINLDGDCLITLDQPLLWDHQGSPVENGSIQPRLQAEVLNHSRSILITGGASCPDGIIQQVISKINGFFPNEKLRSMEKVLYDLKAIEESEA